MNYGIYSPQFNRIIARFGFRAHAERFLFTADPDGRLGFEINQL